MSPFATRRAALFAKRKATLPARFVVLGRGEPYKSIIGPVLVALGVFFHGARSDCIRNVASSPWRRPVRPLGSRKAKLTAFIPSAFGLLLIFAGIIARDEKKRKHAMHIAAAVGLLGFAFPLGRVIVKVVRADPEKPFNPLADGGQLAMSAICGVFVALCVKSFINARKARKQAEAA